MAKELNTAQVNHLRRLLGWVRCSEGVFQSPEEMVESLRKIAPHAGDIDEASKQRLAASYAKAASVPLYVRAAIKALEPVVREAEGQVVEAEGAGLPAKSRSRPKRQVSFFRRGLVAPK